MSNFVVTYTGKDGKPATSAQMSEKVATMYAKTVRHGVVKPVESSAPVPEVQVTVCKPAGLEDLKASAKAYYDRHWNPRAPSTEETVTSEQRAEREVEYVTQGRLMGGDVNDLLDDLQYMP